MNPDLLCPPIDRFDFGVCLRDRGDRSFFRVPIRPEVEVVFQDALITTVEEMKGDHHASLTTLGSYDPAEKHETVDPCVVPLTSPWMSRLRELAEITDFETNGTILQDNPGKVFFYFCRFTKGADSFLGLRKANQFKSSLKTKNAIWRADELELAGGNVFRLDDFFDAVVTDDQAYILRPKDFEYVADLEQVMRESAVESIRSIDEQLPFVDLSRLATQMERGGSIRRARLAASVAARADLNLTDRQLFAQACSSSGITLQEDEGVLSASEEQSWDLLTVLDRRRYWMDLIPGQHEIYEAASRERV